VHIAYDHRHHNRHGSSTPALTRARPDHWRLRIEIDYAISQIDAGHLRPGYRLQNPDGSWAEVVSVVERAEPLDAWNLTVEDANSYFVAGEAGAQPVWVHNSCFEFDKFKYMHDEMRLDRYSNLSNNEIVSSLFRGEDRLLVGKDGLIWKGNERIKILEQRGFDMKTIKDQMTYENLYTPSPLGNWWEN